MSRADRDQNALFADIHPAKTMGDSDAHEAMFLRYSLGDRHESAKGEGRVGGVGEVGDGRAGEGVAGTA